jgi:beta-N-acetylhexosaminidase
VEQAKAFLGGLARERVLACGKYFPGMSGARLDRSSRLLVVSKPMAQMWNENLVPYRRLLNQLPLVMVSHAAYKAYDFDILRPAAVSVQVLEGLLRVKLGYRGVAATDQLDSEYVRRTVDPVGFAVQALDAGCDLLLVHDWRIAEAVLAGLAKACVSEKLSSRRLGQASKRLSSITRQLSPPTVKLTSRAWNQLTREAMRFEAPDRLPEQKIA